MFNLADALKDVPISDTGAKLTGREQIEYISIDRIDPDPNNFYSMDGIEELAANIELLGLQQPLRIRSNPDAEGRFIVVSGHRRRAAIKMLVDEGKEQFSQVPCIKDSTASEALQKLRLIYANANTRALSAAEISKQAEEVEQLLYELKEQGVEFPGRMRDHVAEACKVSKSKLARLKVIREGLVHDYTVAFNRNELSESVAYSLARCPAELQEKLAEANINANANKIDELARAWEAGHHYETCLHCPSGKNCHHAKGFLRHDATSYASPCYGETCCLKCRWADAYTGCSNVCSVKKKVKAEDRAEANAKEAEKQANQQAQLRAEISESAARILRAAESAEIKGSIKVCFGYTCSSYTIDDLQHYASGEFSGHPYTNPFNVNNLTHIADLAKALHCSADYLVGLTDELHPSAAPQWHDGAPTEPGEYLCAIDFHDGDEPVKLILYFDGNMLRYPANGSCFYLIEGMTVKYLKLPEV